MSDVDGRTSGAPGQRDIDLLEVPIALWRNWRLIGACALIGLVVSSLYLHVATYRYTAELTVIPVQSSGGGAAGRLGGIADLASLAGVSLPKDQGFAQYQLYFEGIHSRSVADALSKRTDLMKVIFRSEWDEKTKSWRQPTSPLRPIVQAFKFILGIPNYDWQPPDGARLLLYMNSEIKVAEDPKKALATISFDHRDPKFAVAFLRALHDTVEGQLRQKALSVSRQYVSYLSEQLKTVTMVEQRQAIMNALVEQEKSVMMASSNAPFAAESFGDPTASYRPTSPVPILVLALGFLIGAAVGAGIAMFSLVRPLAFPALPEWVRSLAQHRRARRTETTWQS
jgi:uncharacterized protein involved in exopolysaccharide biosynthesis